MTGASTVESGGRRLTVFSDYLQIHLRDEDSTVELADPWSDPGNPLPDHLALAEDAVAVFTGVNGEVTVDVTVTDGPPVDEGDGFAEVVECGLLVLAGAARATGTAQGLGSAGGRVGVALNQAGGAAVPARSSTSST